MNRPIEFKDVERMLISIANKFHRRHGGDIGDMIQEAYLGFVKVAKNPKCITGGTTFIYKCVWNHMQRYIWQQHVRCGRKYAKVHPYPADEIHNAFPIESDRKQNAALSNDAQQVISIVTGKAEMSQMNRPVKSRQALITLLKRCGWTVTRITTTFREIEAAMA